MTSSVRLSPARFCIDASLQNIHQGPGRPSGESWTVPLIPWTQSHNHTILHVESSVALCRPRNPSTDNNFAEG